MAEFDPEQVRKLGELVQLSLSREDCERFTSELTRILAFAERIQALDTEGGSPRTHLADAEIPLREDVPEPGLDRDRALSGAPDASEGLFRVPKVLP